MSGLRAPPKLIIVTLVGVVDGTDPDGQCEIIGVGPVPREILKTLTPDTEFLAAETLSQQLGECPTQGRVLAYRGWGIPMIEGGDVR